MQKDAQNSNQIMLYLVQIKAQVRNAQHADVVM